MQISDTCKPYNKYSNNVSMICAKSCIISYIISYIICSSDDIKCTLN